MEFCFNLAQRVLINASRGVGTLQVAIGIVGLVFYFVKKPSWFFFKNLLFAVPCCDAFNKSRAQEF